MKYMIIYLSYSEIAERFNTELEWLEILFYQLALVRFDRELEVLEFFFDHWLKSS